MLLWMFLLCGGLLDSPKNWGWALWKASQIWKKHDMLMWIPAWKALLMSLISSGVWIYYLIIIICILGSIWDYHIPSSGKFLLNRAVRFMMELPLELPRNSTETNPERLRFEWEPFWCTGRHRYAAYAWDILRSFPVWDVLLLLFGFSTFCGILWQKSAIPNGILFWTKLSISGVLNLWPSQELSLGARILIQVLGCPIFWDPEEGDGNWMAPAFTRPGND